MKILLTGATGLIGKELGKLLVSQGHQVVAVSRSARWARLHCPFPAEFIEWSGQEKFNSPIADTVEGVIHLMGENLSEGRWTNQMKQSLVNSRVESTQLLRESFEHRTTPLKFWVQGSAIGFYGSSDSERVFDEASPKGNGFLADLCDDWESALNSTKTDFESVRKVILRTGVVISHKGGALVKMMNPLLAGVGGVVSGGKLLRDQAVKSIRIEEDGFKLRYPGLNEIIAESSSWYLDPISAEEGKPKPAHLMYSEQFIPLPREKVFHFFSEAKNLERITPDFLQFNIVGMNTEKVEKNTKITYRLKLHGIPFGWLTDIAVWDPPFRFVDNQLKGPYQLWYHEHAFEELAGGTLMRDWVRFRLPLGKAGMVGLPKVLNDVGRIFAYRTEIIDEILLSD